MGAVAAQSTSHDAIGVPSSSPRIRLIRGISQLSQYSHTLSGRIESHEPPARVEPELVPHTSFMRLACFHMTFPFLAETDGITRKRRKLSIDYQMYTHDRLAAHSGSTRGPARVASQCFKRIRRQFLSHYVGPPPRWRVWIRQLQKARALPDFCIIGPGKSGTSDLAVTVMSHPNVIPPLIKEFRTTDPLSWKPFYPTLSALQRHARRHGIALCPFVGPCLHHLDIPITLSALSPSTKIIIALRNPVDLVFSIWKWNVLHKERQFVDRVPFLATFPAYVDKALEVFPEALSPIGSPLHFGIYVTSVVHWLQAFDRANVMIFDVAGYFKDRNEHIKRLEQFLGLPHASLPPGLPVTNRNPLTGITPDHDTCLKLKQFFEPYNRRLWQVIGTVYDW